MTEHAGDYRIASPGEGPSITVLARNGQLYMQVKLHSTQPALRLREYRPGLFITPDGKPVRFGDGRMTFGDIAFVKQR